MERLEWNFPTSRGNQIGKERDIGVIMVGEIGDITGRVCIPAEETQDWKSRMWQKLERLSTAL